jgi:hypothetical protein
MTELNDLYNIYRSNIRVDDFPIPENSDTIKVGDILVAYYNNREIRGEVAAVYENYYVLKGKNGSSLKVTMDDITEHYPKNRSFVKKFTESTIQQQIPQQKREKPIERVQQKTKSVIDEGEEEEEKNSPDNSIDLATENLKPIGKLMYYRNMKYSQVESMFEKKLLSKEEYWYLLTEKQNEIHIIRNNEKGFQIQPFANALVGHFLKSQNKLITESYNQIKVSGNSSFSVISNIPQNVHKQLLNSLIGLLSGIKK